MPSDFFIVKLFLSFSYFYMCVFKKKPCSSNKMIYFILRVHTQSQDTNKAVYLDSFYKYTRNDNAFKNNLVKSVSGYNCHF